MLYLILYSTDMYAVVISMVYKAAGLGSIGNAVMPACLITPASTQALADHISCRQVVVEPNETLFETGDDSSSGIFIVLEGAVGVYMHDGDHLLHTNTLRPGESVGDVDILDGG